ncbi:hypothetical protein [Maridesulfovibrio ferrireducens]|uniref:hypothetical protein n=1 Tax=Maridesulfovibrio ferrireducens TaxID=246191 RepID=UPI001A1D8566|nr:hypothetical protein [Maridesulfovibrio ferrireducens]MBI9113270.1 hypothetical protein [Maridesulfovibrio ferrireducens]
MAKLSKTYLFEEMTKAVQKNENLISFENWKEAKRLTKRVAVYHLSQAGAKYAGNVEGPRRNHGLS